MKIHNKKLEPKGICFSNDYIRKSIKAFVKQQEESHKHDISICSKLHKEAEHE